MTAPSSAVPPSLAQQNLAAVLSQIPQRPVPAAPSSSTVSSESPYQGFPPRAATQPTPSHQGVPPPSLTVYQPLPPPKHPPPISPTIVQTTNTSHSPSPVSSQEYGPIPWFQQPGTLRTSAFASSSPSSSVVSTTQVTTTAPVQQSGNKQSPTQKTLQSSSSAPNVATPSSPPAVSNEVDYEELRRRALEKYEREQRENAELVKKRIEEDQKRLQQSRTVPSNTQQQTSFA